MPELIDPSHAVGPAPLPVPNKVRYPTKEERNAMEAAKNLEKQQKSALEYAEKRKRIYFPKGFFGSKPPISAAESYKWVCEHIRCEDVTMFDAPSAEAWALYQWASVNGDNFTVFMQKYMDMVVKVQVGKEADSGRLDDDGRPNEELFAAVRELLDDRERQQSTV